jgi:hypothetical protein
MHRQASNAAIGTLISERQFRQKMGFANGSEEKAAVKAAFSFFMKIGIRLITVSVYRVLQMRGGGYADVLPVLQVPDNKADAVPCERLLDFDLFCLYLFLFGEDNL